MNFVLEIRAFTKQETIIKADEFRLESTGWIPQEFSRLPQRAITRIRPRLSPLVALLWPAEPFSLARVRKRKKARRLSRSCDDRLVRLRRYVTLFQPFIFRLFAHVSLLPSSSPPSVSFSPFHHFFRALFSPLCSLSSESRTRWRARTRARSCSCKSYPILLQLYVELLFFDVRSRRLSGTRLLGFFHVLILLLLHRCTADSSFSVLVG